MLEYIAEITTVALRTGIDGITSSGGLYFRCICLKNKKGRANENSAFFMC
jgi:hypothetical protein